MALTLPLLRAIDRRIVQWSHRSSERVVRTELAFSRQVHNVLSCVPLVKAHGLEVEVLRSYNDLIERIRSLTFAGDRVRLAATPLQQGVVLTTLFILICIAVVSSGSDHTAAFSVVCAFLLVVRRAVPYLGFTTTFRIGYSQARPNIERLSVIFDDRDKFFVSSGSREFRGLKRGIELRKLTFSYVEGLTVLRDVSAFLPAGQTTALVGETGCGKTTVASIVTRLYECPPGTVFFDDVDIREYSRESVARAVAFVGQDAWLFNDSLRANLSLGVEGALSDQDLTHALEEVRLGALLARLPDGLDTEIGDRGIRLSGGERQRLCIARALLRRAEIMVLDEATASLDSRTERDVLDVLERVTRSRTVITIAHRLSTIRTANQILVLSGGRVIQTGQWSDLVATPGPFASMWEVQTRTTQEPAAANAETA
jgi:ABC-type multidrug transport system fused ATPase/permease subunit